MKRREALKKTALLGGSAAVSTSLLTLLQSCQQQSRLGWQPRFLSEDHAQLVSSLVDALLPATDTPGGLDVKVDMFIDLVFARMYDETARQQAVEEMDRFNERCVARFGNAFHRLDTDKKVAVLQAEEAGAPRFNGSVWGTPVGKQQPVGFYRTFKSLAVWGYCTSEEIGRSVLKYDPIPGDYLGCIPFSDVGKVWSL